MYKIIFNPVNHTYQRTSDGMLYMPVTHFVRRFTEDFKGEHHCKKGAAEKCIGNKKFSELKAEWLSDTSRHGLQPEYIAYLEQHVPNWDSYVAEQARIKEVWRVKSETGAGKGTAHHDWKYDAAVMRGFEVNEIDGKEYPVKIQGHNADGSCESFVDSLGNLEPGFYPELMIWHTFPEPVYSESAGCWIAGICGRSDRVFVDEWRCFYLSDYKTDKDKTLDDFGIRFPNYGFVKMLPPFQNRRETAKNKYSLQLNVYSWMLENHGLICENIFIIHKDQNIDVHYEPDMVSTSVSMLFNNGM